MTSQFNWAQLLAISLLVASVCLGLFTSKKIKYRVFHNVVSVSLLLIVVLGLPLHLSRFSTKGPYNWISWIHIIIFSFLIYISVLALRKWNQSHEHYQKKPLLVSYKGEQYDISSFVPNHPGGSVIKKAENQDLETIWKENGVSWHNTNKRVQETLSKLKK